MPDPTQLSAGAIDRGPQVLDGAALIGLVLDDTYSFDIDHETAADVVAAEVSGTGYVRPTATARVERISGSWFLFIDDQDDVDLSDVDDRGGIYWFVDDATDADRLSVGWAADSGAAVDPYHPTWDSGFAEFPIVPVGDRVAALEAMEHNDFGGRSVADAHPASAIDVDGTPLDEYLADLSGGGGTSGADHRVAFFVNDVDMAGGSFTDVPRYDSSPIPRSYLVGVPVLVLEGGSLGLWTITGSGPCTAGAVLAAGDLVSTLADDGFVAVTVTPDGSTVTGVKVQATADALATLQGTVDTLSSGLDGLDTAQSATAATVDTQGNAIIELQKTEPADAVATDLIAYAETATAPSKWAKCGWGVDPMAQEAGHWYCNTLLPSPSSTMRVRRWVRTLSGDGTDNIYQENFSEPMDSEGVPEAGGAWDRFEYADHFDTGRLWDFYEWTQVGGSIEWWADQDPQVEPPHGHGMVATIWREVETHTDFTTGTITLRARTNGIWDYIDPDDGTKWVTLQTYEAGPTSLEASNGVEMWVGRGPGRFDVARVRCWMDGTLAMDFDPSTAAADATTITDSVLLDGGDPAVWTARWNAAVEAAPPAGDVGGTYYDSSLIGTDPFVQTDGVFTVTAGNAYGNVVLTQNAYVVQASVSFDVTIDVDTAGTGAPRLLPGQIFGALDAGYSGWYWGWSGRELRTPVWGTIGGVAWSGWLDRNGYLLDADGTTLERVLASGDNLHGTITGVFQND